MNASPEKKKKDWFRKRRKREQRRRWEKKGRESGKSGVHREVMAGGTLSRPSGKRGWRGDEPENAASSILLLMVNALESLRRKNAFPRTTEKKKNGVEWGGPDVTRPSSRSTNAAS